MSYKNAEKDVKTLTGVSVSAKTQQRLVHRHKFELPSCEDTVEELSVDGGKIRLITPKGEECIWRDYKGIRLHEQVTLGFFQENDKLIDWANSQPLNNPITCLGDGHDGIWNIITKICSIGSGAVESAVKQIDRRTKISGAQWKTENVPQVLAHRCAYLNDQIV